MHFCAEVKKFAILKTGHFLWIELVQGRSVFSYLYKFEHGFFIGYYSEKNIKLFFKQIAFERLFSNGVKIEIVLSLEV